MVRKTIGAHLEQILTSLPTAFSRLAFLTSVRDPATGRYLHEGWYSLASPEEVHEVMRQTHLQIFAEVLTYSLSKICRELGAYLEGISEAGRRGKTVRVWLELESFREMIPQGCSDIEREFFFAQVRAALKVLELAPDRIPLPVPSAWQSPQLARQYQRHRDN